MPGNVRPFLNKTTHPHIFLRNSGDANLVLSPATTRELIVHSPATSWLPGYCEPDPGLPKINTTVVSRRPHPFQIRMERGWKIAWRKATIIAFRHNSSQGIRARRSLLESRRRTQLGPDVQISAAKWGVLQEMHPADGFTDWVCNETKKLATREQLKYRTLDWSLQEALQRCSVALFPLIPVIAPSDCGGHCHMVT